MTPEEVFDRDSIPSPGGWTVPVGERAGWTCSPGRGQPAPERMPLWVRVWARTPIIDRFALGWMWSHGGFRVLPPDHPFFAEYGPEAYEAASGISKTEYERQLLKTARDALNDELGARGIALESVELDGEGLDTRIVALFGIAEYPGRRFGHEVTVWPSPHPDDYEGSPEWGAMLPTLVSAAIADPEHHESEPDADGITWLR